MGYKWSELIYQKIGFDARIIPGAETDRVRDRVSEGKSAKAESAGSHNEVLIDLAVIRRQMDISIILVILQENVTLFPFLRRAKMLTYFFSGPAARPAAAAATAVS